jgi:hypothetical protein
MHTRLLAGARRARRWTATSPSWACTSTSRAPGSLRSVGTYALVAATAAPSAYRYTHRPARPSGASAPPIHTHAGSRGAGSTAPRPPMQTAPPRGHHAHGAPPALGLCRAVMSRRPPQARRPRLRTRRGGAAPAADGGDWVGRGLRRRRGPTPRYVGAPHRSHTRSSRYPFRRRRGSRRMTLPSRCRHVAVTLPSRYRHVTRRRWRRDSRRAAARASSSAICSPAAAAAPKSLLLPPPQPPPLK